MFFTYLKSKWRTLTACGAFCALFFLSFALYQLPLAAVAYPVGLCVLLGMGLLIVDFLRVRRDCRDLNRIQTANAADAVSLPAASRPVECAYQALIARIRDEQAQLLSEASLRYDRMLDYYTLWAHQIKTPIAAMRLQLQREDTAFSHACLLELTRVERYVQMLMAYLRLESDDTDYVFREIDLDAVIRAAVKRFSSEFIARKIGLAYESVDLRVVPDEKWLQFVLEQLISNALKYTSAGSVTIARTHSGALMIRDTGIGIAPDDLPRIFSRGFTGKNGREDKSASGLGLYLCHRVCQNLDIQISADSEPGRGTSVYLRFAQRAGRPE